MTIRDRWNAPHRDGLVPLEAWAKRHHLDELYVLNWICQPANRCATGAVLLALADNPAAIDSTGAPPRVAWNRSEYVVEVRNWFFDCVEGAA